jgi:hypothetical protein
LLKVKKVTNETNTEKQGMKSEALHFILHPSSLKLNRPIHLPALRASRTFHIRVIRVHRSATFTPENPVLFARRLEPPSTKLGIYCQDRNPGK